MNVTTSAMVVTHQYRFITYLNLTKAHLGPPGPAILRLQCYHVGLGKLQVRFPSHPHLPGHKLNDGHRLGELFPIPEENWHLSDLNIFPNFFISQCDNDLTDPNGVLGLCFGHSSKPNRKSSKSMLPMLRRMRVSSPLPSAAK